MRDPLDVWLQRLRDPDPATRRQAIRQIELIGDPRALGALANLFALDPDLEIRKLAQSVGKAIYQAAQRRLAHQRHTTVASDHQVKHT
ncbi:MAG: HEAT repeat domain-containing protein [Anaerolineae bacterium]|nr:HEAT repeat domain-containing protein [Anaerolineae bacterium]MDW8299381.1 HEAT repeat domain-containing protein [Anaerolineae bacterium]